MNNVTILRLAYPGLIITLQQYVIIIESCSFVWTILSVWGIVSNIVNIKTFIIMGIGDGVTVSLLALSIFDLLYVTASLCLGVAIIFYIAEIKYGMVFGIEPYGVSMFFGNIMILISIANVLSTTFITVARCMCVARPLQFRNTFTRNRTISWCVVFVVFTIAVYSPILTHMGMVTRFDIKRNISRPSFWISPNREFVKAIVWVVTDMFLPFATQIIVILSVIVMANCLRVASEFRHFANADVVRRTDVRITDNETETREQYEIVSGNHRLTGKELRVVQQVILIAVVYIVCNTPKILISITAMIEPQFAIGSRYNNLYLSVNCLRKHCEIINASVNTFIYYAYNTKFRKTVNLAIQCSEDNVL
ncbi:unnamed protein product [Candidula unifasciata]|uniref:G-protein coupled receptors family 1 profile domain-containing protein n=1 Tax=Candidula unifasciata TaxID=100452 RepID=A0A8S3ZAD1_9EUPU|nr:unnamed protein product [Candidula unifasciata]